MKRLVFVATMLLSACLAAGVASAANPYQDRHFAHYALHDAFALQDFHRHSYAAGYPATVWKRELPLDFVAPVPPVGELPPVPLPPQYEYRRRSYEYQRAIVPTPVPAPPPGSPRSYEPPRAVPSDTSPSDLVPRSGRTAPWRRAFSR